MGGSVVIVAANKIPKKIKGVVLVDAIHNAEMTISKQMIAYMDSVMMDLIANPTNEKLMAGGFYKQNPEESYNRVLSMLDDTIRVGWRETLQSTLRWQNESLIESLNKLQTPLVLINSDRMPTNEESFRKYVSLFQSKIITNTGHVIMWDAPEEFNNLLKESISYFNL